MSVLVKKLKSNSVEVYVKGAPEVMTEICDKSTREYASDVLPPDTDCLPYVSSGRLRGDVIFLHATRIPSHCSGWKEYSWSDLDQISANEEVREIDPGTYEPY